MTSLMFVVPAAGRVGLTAICLRQLRRTCDKLEHAGIKASAVVVADDENLDTAADLGFAVFGRRNTWTSRKFNDGLQLACDPAFNPRPADYAVPFGSDDWADWRLFLNLPRDGSVLAFRRASFVREDGQEMIGCDIDYTAGIGMRVYPRRLLEACNYRPADEERRRGCDTSIFVNLFRALGRQPQITYAGSHYHQFVDWKTTGEQLNGYREIKARFRRGLDPADPWQALAGLYPDAALAEMRGYYDRIRQRPVIADHEGGLPLYQVLRHNGYRGHRRGTEFTARLGRASEQRALVRGDIRILTPNTPAIQPGSYTLPASWARNPAEEVAAR
jgi:hypothetical protein